MIYCCGNNLVQAEANNANVFDEMAYMLWISSYYMKQVYLRMSVRHKVMHIKWSHLKSLLRNQGRSRWIHEIDLNVYLPLVQIIVWLGLACEGEDSKKRALKDQARVKDKQWLGHRWTTTMVKKRVLALKWEVAL